MSALPLLNRHQPKAADCRSILTISQCVLVIGRIMVGSHRARRRSSICWTNVDLSRGEPRDLLKAGTTTLSEQAEAADRRTKTFWNANNTSTVGCFLFSTLILSSLVAAFHHCAFFSFVQFSVVFFIFCCKARPAGPLVAASFVLRKCESPGLRCNFSCLACSIQ